MKAYICALGTLLALTLSVASHARTRAKTGTAPAVTRTTASNVESHSRFGIGFATYGNAEPTTTQLVNPAASAWWDINALNSLQFVAGIAGTSPSFGFGVGAAYRYTVVGSQDLGAHIGLGFNLGTMVGTGTFFLDFMPIGGFHFGLGGHLSNIQLSFDGGPMFHATPSPFQMSLGALSQFAGASIHYFF